MTGVRMAVAGEGAPAAASPSEEALAAPAYVGDDPLAIRSLAGAATSGSADDRERAVRLHDVVRAPLFFGVASRAACGRLHGVRSADERR